MPVNPVRGPLLSGATDSTAQQGGGPASNGASITVLGIDPGTSRMGYGVVTLSDGTLSYLACGIVSAAPGLPDALRLKDLYKHLTVLMKKYRPNAVGVEDLFFTNNKKTAIAVAGARGIALLVAAQRGVPAHTFTPPQVKQAVAGYGQADKRQVQHMTKSLLKLSAVPRPDDAADALAVAICCAHSLPMLQLQKG
ncbi:MAG: crossover junction endodeoxyribonuclease RuvC [Candidatus Spechtbacterales bacterium]